MILLDPATYRRQPWRNGLGVSEEIAAERDEGATDGWDRLGWSLSLTGFSGPSRFSDLSGFDRILALVTGRGLTLRALDGGGDLIVPPAGAVAFGGERVLEGAPDGPVRVVNLIGRRGRVRIGLEWLAPGTPRRFASDVVLVVAPLGAASLAGTALAPGATLRLDSARLEVRPEGSTVLVASIDRVGD